MIRLRRESSSYPEVYALLWLTRQSESKIVDFFRSWVYVVRTFRTERF